MGAGVRMALSRMGATGKLLAEFLRARRLSPNGTSASNTSALTTARIFQIGLCESLTVSIHAQPPRVLLSRNRHRDACMEQEPFGCLCNGSDHATSG